MLTTTPQRPRAPRWATRLIVWVLALTTTTLGLVTLSATMSQAAGAPTNPVVTVAGANAITMSWGSVSGASNYRVQYSTSSTFSSTTPGVTVATTQTTVVGLKVNTTYYFRVAVSTTSGDTTGNTWSAVKSGKTSYFYAAPTGFAVDNIGGSFIEFHWTGVSGAPGYRVKAESTGNPTIYQSVSSPNATVTGLKKSTTYTLQVYVEQPPTGDLPAVQQGPYSSSLSATTSDYDLPAPGDFSVAHQGTSSIDLTWTAPQGMTGDFRYQVQYALDTSMSVGATWYPQTTTGTSLTVTGLQTNTNYYMRLRVIDSTGKQRSDRSDYLLGKTRLETGTIKGTMSGAPTRETVVDAYTASGELAAQSNVASDGSYSLTVRPGSYRLHVTYLGRANLTSLWATSGSDGSRLMTEATAITVSTGQAITAPPVRLGQGATISGTIVDPTGEPVGAVDVSALADVGDEEVIDTTRSAPNGAYALQGLPDGKYWLRMVYSKDGFRTRSIWVDVVGKRVVSVRVSSDPEPTAVNGVAALNAKLDLAPFRTSYGAYIDGTKSVGKTVSAHATSWLAGSYPTTRASMTYQWKRNGTPIPGATASTYKITSADRGKKLSLTAKATRYGYITGYVTSRGYSVS